MNSRDLKKILYLSKNVFSSNSNDIEKINEEPHSYKIGNTKMYIFEKKDLMDFLLWYYDNYREEFLLDLLFNNKNIKIVWKYFTANINGFTDNYPNVEIFENNIIRSNNMTNIIHNLIESVGIIKIINDVIIFKNRQLSIGIRFIRNTMYKFATDKLIQIFL